MPTSHPRTGSYRDHAGGTHQEAARPYGAWHPLVRVGHFLLMAAASCLIIFVGLGVLGALLLLIATLAK